MSSVTTKTYPKLTTLGVHIPHKIIRMDQGIVSSLLQHFPQLRILKLSPISGWDILPAVDQHCPFLQQLILTGHWVDHPHMPIMHDDTGLRVLRVAPSEEPRNNNDDDIMQYMMKHSHTMEIFEFAYGKGFNTVGEMLLPEQVGKVIFNNLREIQYPANVNDAFITFALWMMQHAPQLESVGTVTGLNQQRVLQELMKPTQSHLKRIVMISDGAESSDEESFLQHHIRLGNRSKLQEIKAILSYDAPWIWSLPSLSQLTSLELYGDTPGSFEFLEEFTEGLSHGCPALEQLTLTNTTGNPCSFDDIMPMCEHRNLKRIVITANEMRRGGAYSFSSEFRTLQSFHLNLYRFKPSDIADLEKGSFTLVCTQRKSRPTFQFQQPAWKRHRHRHRNYFI